MSSALSLSAAIPNRALGPAREAVPARGLGDPGSRAGAADFTAADLAPLLRGHARVDDGAAFALCARLGLSPAAVARVLPEARKLAGA